MTLDELVALLQRALKDHCGKSGAVLYSGRATLAPGDVYIMGLNPGGDPNNDGHTILESLDSLVNKSPYYSAYLDQKWGSWQGNGNSPHQKRVAEICQLLGQEVREVFSANALFVRSIDAKSADLRGEELNIGCEVVHRALVSVVRPRLMICLGNGDGLSAFAIARKWFAPGAAIHYCGASRTFRDGKYFDAKIETRDVRVVGVPHPSRFPVTEPLRSFLRKQAARLVPTDLQP